MWLLICFRSRKPYEAARGREAACARLRTQHKLVLTIFSDVYTIFETLPSFYTYVRKNNSQFRAFLFPPEAARGRETAARGLARTPSSTSVWPTAT